MPLCGWVLANHTDYQFLQELAGVELTLIRSDDEISNQYFDCSKSNKWGASMCKFSYSTLIVYY